MKFFQKRNPGKTAAKAEENTAPTGTIEQLRRDTKRLWELFREAVAYYHSLACLCAFPRFVQYTSMDCRETQHVFYMSEAEGFIHAAADAYDVQQIDKGDECYKAIYTCKTCGSVFLCLWSDFSISLNRSCLKPITLKAEPVGAEPQKPIPFYVGIFGYSYPERSDFRQVDYESFRDYIYALKAR